MHNRNYDTKEREDSMKKVFGIKYQVLSIKKLLLLLLAYCLLITVPCLLSPVYASYVLPYPSFMPGNKLYKVSRAVDVLKKYWYFGSIAQVKYHMSLSDKYLVEAKTLFEYRQYLLGVDALKRSDNEFRQIPIHIQQGDREGKDMSVWKQMVAEASLVHTDILDKLILISPKEFQWSPEKDTPTTLPLHELLDQSIVIRSTIPQE